LCEGKPVYVRRVLQVKADNSYMLFRLQFHISSFS
jgi:hypothetical protein